MRSPIAKCSPVAVLLVSTASAAGAGTFFDFGPGDSPVAAGFTAVTEEDGYTPEKGYGWEKGSRVHSRTENFSSNRNFLKLDDLLCDKVAGGQNYFYGRKPYVFLADRPEGEHVGAVILGALTEKKGTTINRPPFWYRGYSVKVNGREVVTVERGDWRKHLSGFYAVMEGDFLPGDGLYDKYVAPHFEVHTFSFRDRLRLELSSVCPLNVLVIYPKSRERELQRKLAEMTAAARSFLDGQYRESRPEAEKLSDELGAGHRRQGFILFTRPHATISPYSRPEAREVNRSADRFAAAGQTAVLSFALLPLKELKDVQVRATDLTSRGGARIAGERLSVWRAHYYAQPTVQTGDYYRITPFYAFRHKRTDFGPMVARSFSVYAKVPPDTPPGVYEGHVEIVPANTAPRSLQVRLKVLPFRLDEPDMLFGMYYYYPHSTIFRFAYMGRLRLAEDPALRKGISRLNEKMLREMKEIGFNTISASPPGRPMRIDDNGTITTDPNAWGIWKDFMDQYKRILGEKPLTFFGMGWSSFAMAAPGGPWSVYSRDQKIQLWEQKGIPQKAARLLEKLIANFYREARSLDWPEVIFYASDELSNEGLRGGRYGKAMAGLYKRIGRRVGFRVCASMNGTAEHQMLPNVDIVIPNGAFPINEEGLKKIRDAGCDLWFYNIGSNRFTFGYYLAKTRPKCRLQWNYAGASRYFNQAPFPPSLGRLSYAPILDSNLDVGRRSNVEQIRRGIVDYRYYITLERLVKRHKGSRKPKLRKALEKAERVLDLILTGVKTDLKHYGRVGNWGSKTCHRVRWMIATSIMEVLDAAR